MVDKVTIMQCSDPINRLRDSGLDPGVQTNERAIVTMSKKQIESPNEPLNFLKGKPLFQNYFIQIHLFNMNLKTADILPSLPNNNVNVFP